jgi:hypothetical protein
VGFGRALRRGQKNHSGLKPLRQRVDTTRQPIVCQSFARIESLADDLPTSAELVIAEQVTGLEERKKQHARIRPK